MRIFRPTIHWSIYFGTPYDWPEKAWPRCSGPVALLQGQQGLHHAEISSALIHGITWRWSATKAVQIKGAVGRKRKKRHPIPIWGSTEMTYYDLFLGEKKHRSEFQMLIYAQFGEPFCKPNCHIPMQTSSHKGLLLYDLYKIVQVCCCEQLETFQLAMFHFRNHEFG